MKAWWRTPTCALVLGTRLAEEYTCHWTVPFAEALVQVDIDAARLGANYPIVEGIVSDVGLFCDAVLASEPRRGRPRRRCRCPAAALSGRASEVAAQGFTVEAELLRALDQALPDGRLSCPI